MNIQKQVPPDSAALKDRLNQPRITRAEALKQLQTTIPLSSSAMQELQSNSSDSNNGQATTKS